MHENAETAADRDNADILHQRVLTLFCEALEVNQAQPMDVLEHLATALGKVYREVADSHLPPRNCVCGWEPSEYSDVHSLQFALARAALSGGRSSLALSPVIGHA
ncbi:MAG: hypothetical protein ACO1O4_14180 [Devosia sp.]